MKSFWRVYGKSGLAVMLMILFAAILVIVMSQGWKMYGTFTNTGDSPAIGKKGGETMVLDKPVLYAKSVRVIQGERLLLSDLAAAKDAGGENLDEWIRFSDEKGNLLDNQFDTSTPGCFLLTLSVRSNKTGKTVKRTITILVDGRV